ncbi:MAG: diaminopimelate epimerase [Defluviitaleaceae bacterium]|nr:diaminopimelate epimerase [Defluviitaleaceae bacterium]
MFNRLQCQESAELGTFSFVKMHGCGNDYIYFDCFESEMPSPESVVGRLTDRNTGIGGDGIVLIQPSGRADAKMRIFNPDGSESGMDGNSIRCVGKYLYESGRVKKPGMIIETPSGDKRLDLIIEKGEVTAVRVDMGQVWLRPEEIPVNLPGEAIVGRPVNITSHPYEITCVNVGNPHAVIFHHDIDHFDLSTIGPLFECAPVFPERINVEVAQILSRNNLKMRVWDRGVGETMANGTGACAAAVAAVLMGYCDKDADIHVGLRGGGLIIKYTDETVYMTGDCVRVFEGTVKV